MGDNPTNNQGAAVLAEPAPTVTTPPVGPDNHVSGLDDHIVHPDTTGSSPVADTSTVATTPVPDISSAPPALESTPTIDSTPSAPSPSEPSPVVKILGLLVLAAVVIGGLAFAGYYLGVNRVLAPEATPTPTPIVEATPEPTPTPNPTADWQSYENTKFSYSIEFPKELKTLVGAAGAGAKEATAESSLFDIYDPVKSTSSDTFSYLTLSTSAAAPTYTSEWKGEKTTLNGIEANKYTSTKADANSEVYLMLLPDNKGYLELTAQIVSDKKELANLILSTLQFDDSTK